MHDDRWSRFLVLLCLGLLLAACGGGEPEASRWDEAQQTSVAEEAADTENGDAAANGVVPGSEFNQFFPAEAAEDAGFDFAYEQERDGFAQATLDQDGTLLASLAVSDTAANPAAADKFADSNGELAGYPLYEEEFSTAILVDDRFQVQVFSEDDAFTADDRAEWITQFDLDGLAELDE